ncbi:outer membrane beta-barrel protein [Ascidiimonas aurantiaca]|uniref:outer membrane beta-barrel protein n=1 Tax=Ascidiimonas aurantiaca TaxID=1685432 RepID=UPI0030EF0836
MYFIRKLVLIVVLFPFFSLSQNYSVEGQIQSYDNIPVAYANILLLRASDSVVVKGTSSGDNGLFALKGIEKGTYLVKISFIGYREMIKELRVEKDVNLGILKLQEEAEKLEDVTLTAPNRNRPKLERKPDRIIFTVENTSLTDTNIWDLLQRTPGILIINDQLTVRGAGDVQVMINERKISLPYADIMNLLRGTDAGSIKSVEVITNPSARYDAEGGAIVNIVMSKNLVTGYNGSVFTNMTQGVFPKFSTGTGQFFKSEKTQLSFNYTYTDQKLLRKQDETVDYFTNGAIASLWDTGLEQITDSKRHTASMFFDYSIDSRNTLSISAVGSTLPEFDRTYDSRTLIFDQNQQLDSLFTTMNLVNDDNVNAVVNLDYTHQFAKPGAKLIVHGNYTYFDYTRDQNLDTDFIQPDGGKTGDNDFTITSGQRIDIYGAQVDFETPLKNTSSLEAGIKFAGIDSENTITQDGFNQGQPGVDPTEADVFQYNEKIGAAYFSYSKDWNRWSLKTGLRAEYTRTEGISRILDKVNHNDYFELFPTFYLQYTPNEHHDLSINYGRRITRPRYGQINPFQYFINNNAIIQGDPALLPAFRDLLTFSYTIDQTYTFEVYYRFEDQALRQLTFQDNESNILNFINTNIDRELSYGLDFYVYKGITGFWDINLVSSYFYSAERFRNIENNNDLVDNGLWTLYLTFDNYFTLSQSQGLTAELGLEYVSEIVTGNSRQEDYSRLNFSITKQLFHKKGRLTVGIRDIFNDGNLRSARDFADQQGTRFTRDENRLFTVAFRYRFGNLRLKSNTQNKQQEERERLN